MSLSPIERADTSGRKRALLMAMGALVLIVLAGFAATGVPREPVTYSRAAAWAAMVLLWLAMLATGGGLLLNRKVRSLMNDEASLANRRRAIETGFWVTMAAAVAIYLASLAWPVTLRSALTIIANLGSAAALIRYAWLERG